MDGEVIRSSWQGYARDLMGYEDIEVRFGGELDGGCAED